MVDDSTSILKDLVFDCNKKLDELTRKIDEYHGRTVDRTHDLELRMESVENKFKVASWIVSSGGLFGVFIAVKDFFHLHR